MHAKSISIKTPVGNYTLILNSDRAIVAAGFYNPPPNIPTTTDDSLINKYKNVITEYFNGDVNAFKNLTILINGTDFQLKFWNWLKNTSPGSTYSYKEAAEVTGHPNSYRAIGSACKQNPIALIIPCHRIVKHDKSMGEYAYGTKIKHFLLTHENPNSSWLRK